MNSLTTRSISPSFKESILCASSWLGVSHSCVSVIAASLFVLLQVLSDEGLFPPTPSKYSDHVVLLHVSVMFGLLIR